MFIRDSDNGLVFIKSTNIKVFPCGRRRSELVDTDGSNNTVSDKYYIPFDPEARLNTEANNRKHSGLNGFKSDYIKSWTSDGLLSIVLAGYLFQIITDYTSDASFGSNVADKLGISNGSIFVNIRLAEVEFFAGAANVPSANTEILCDQSTSAEPRECLDLFRVTDGASNDKTKLDSYYFYGLSFSAEKITGDGWVSLQLLDYESNTASWAIHEAARLPKIDHGDTKNSVKISGSLTVDHVKDDEGNIITEGNVSVAGYVDANAVKIKDGNNESAYAVTLKVVNNQLQFWTRPANKS